MKTKESFKAYSRIWISTDEGNYLGEGRITLLNEIHKHKSISKAAQSMKMSYKKAWDMVNSMNTIGNAPLVIRTIGGAGGGGSEVTKEGKKAIALFNSVKANSRAFLDQEMTKTDFS